MTRRNSWLLVSCIVVALSLPHLAFSQSEQFCDISDSTASYTTATGLDGISQLFGKDLVHFPNEFDLSADSAYRAFTKVFRLHLTAHPSG
jgi:hypothetical protein